MIERVGRIASVRADSCGECRSDRVRSGGGARGAGLVRRATRRPGRAVGSCRFVPRAAHRQSVEEVARPSRQDHRTIQDVDEDTQARRRVGRRCDHRRPHRRRHPRLQEGERHQTRATPRPCQRVGRRRPSRHRRRVRPPVGPRGQPFAGRRRPRSSRPATPQRPRPLLGRHRRHVEPVRQVRPRHRHQDRRPHRRHDPSHVRRNRP